LKLNVLPNIGCVVLVVKLNAVWSLAATNISVIKPRKQPPNISLLQSNSNKSLLMPNFFKKKTSGSCPSLKPLLSLCAAFSSSVCQSAYCNNKKEKERVFFIQQFLLV